MPRPQGQLERALVDLTIGEEHGQRERQRIDEGVGLHEIEQQVRVPVSGTAGNGWSFADKGVGFQLPFEYAPVQRGAPFRTPHFSYGIEHVVAGSQLVLIHASVLRWNVDPSMRVLGAGIRFAVSAPTAEGETVPFSAEAHLTFQGFAGEIESGHWPSDTDEGGV